MNTIKHNHDMKTHFETIAKINGRAQYANISDLSDDVLIAKVRVVTKNGKEISRDQVIPDSAWMTVAEYFQK